MTNIIVPVGPSLMALPAGGGIFSIGTPPAPIVATFPVYTPQFTLLAADLDPYRSWSHAIIDGVEFIANGHDFLRWWDTTAGALYTAGADTPGAAGGEFAGNAASGALLAPGVGVLAPNDVRTYYFTYFNSKLTRQSPPQQIDVTNNAGVTRDVRITWLPSGLSPQWDKVRIFARFQTAEGFIKLFEGASSLGTWDDTNTWASFETHPLSDRYVPRNRSTRPGRPRGIVQIRGRAYIWFGDDSKVHYGQRTRVSDAEFVQDDFGNYEEIGSGEYGNVVAVLEHDAVPIIWKERAIYALEGDDPATWSVRRLVAESGAVARRTVIPFRDAVAFLDVDGLKLWAPGGDPILTGVDKDGRDTMAPFWKRLNLAAADLFDGVYNERTKELELLVAVDHWPKPNYRVCFDTVRRVFTSIDPWVEGTVLGYLEDGESRRHLCRGDDLRFLWEEYAGNSQGVYLGTLAGSLTGGTIRSWTATGLAFSTALRGATGAPVRRYSSAGAVIDENRVYATAAEALTPLYCRTTVPDATQDACVGVIPGVVESASFAFGEPGDKYLGAIQLSFEEEQASVTILVETETDADGFRVRDAAADLATDEPVDVRADDRGYRWRIRISQDQPGQDFALCSIAVELSDMARTTRR